MHDDLRIGRDWTQDGDRLFLRAQQHLAAFDTALTASELELALLDFDRAAQMYLTGAIQYQRGSEAVAIAAPGSTPTADLLRHLEGYLQAEALAALESSSRVTSRGNPSLTDAVRGQTFARELRDRLSHAVPELFEREPAPAISQPVTRGH